MVSVVETETEALGLRLKLNVVKTIKCETTLLSFPEYITGNSQIALVAPDWYNHMTGDDPT